MKFCVAVSVGVLGCSLLVPAAHAGDPLHLGTDIRRCVASYSGNGSGSTWQDRPVVHEPFKGGANIEVTNGLESWFSSSSQDSRMDGTSMSYSGAGTGTAIAIPLSAPLVSQGQSKFDLYFSITAPTDYSLSGTVAELGHAESQATVRLSVFGGEVIQLVQSTTDSTQPFEFSGTLQPGNYRLYAEATGRGRTGPLQLVSEGEATCSLTFDAGIELFDPADWNRDRFVNTADFFDFLLDFQNNDADFNHSGETDTADLFEFLDAFNR